MSSLPPQHAEYVPLEFLVALHSSQSVWVEGWYTTSGLSPVPVRVTWSGTGISSPVSGKKLLQPGKTDTGIPGCPAGTL
jgi:hypothetical protein